jgi:hypothetical protein
MYPTAADASHHGMRLIKTTMEDASDFMVTSMKNTSVLQSRLPKMHSSPAGQFH